jgi:uncharacterized peroxidase-related enzyme
VERKGVTDSLANGDLSSLSDRERAIVEYARKLTATPRNMSNADVSTLREVGLSDREIHDVVQTAGYFAYVNRLVLALGAEIEGDPDTLGGHPNQPD